MIPTGWSEATSSLRGRNGEPELIWTGSEVLVFDTVASGETMVGERWDPASDTTESLSLDGLSWRYKPAIAWTGSEVLIAGGSSGVLEPFAVAYNPTTDTWRELSEPPSRPGRLDGSEVGGPGYWTGSELLIWRSGLAYNPATDTWRTVPLPPDMAVNNRATSVFTGTHVIVWGGCVGPNCDETNTGLWNQGAVLDLATETWSTLPRSPLAAGVHLVAAWNGREAVFVNTWPDLATGDAHTVAAYDPLLGVWTTLDPVPLSARSHSAAAFVGDVDPDGPTGDLLVWGGGWYGNGEVGAVTTDGAVLDVATGRWTVIHEPLPSAGRAFHSMVAADEFVYISGFGGNPGPLLYRPGDGSARSTTPVVVDTTNATCAGSDDVVVADRDVTRLLDEHSNQGYLIGPAVMFGPVTINSIEVWVVSAGVFDVASRHLGPGLWLVAETASSVERADQDAIIDPTTLPIFSLSQQALDASPWRPTQSSPAVAGLSDDEAKALVRPCVREDDVTVDYLAGSIAWDGARGDTWIVSRDSDADASLCLVLSGENYGCRPVDSDGSAVVASGRLGLHDDDTPADQSGLLAYGALPGGAVSAELVMADGFGDAAPVVHHPTGRFWVAELEPGNNPVEFRYLDANGDVVR